MKHKELIKCDKCGSTNAVDRKLERTKVTVLSMDDYIKKHQNISSPFLRASTQFISCGGVSHTEKRILRCLDCGYTRVWEQVVYS